MTTILLSVGAAPKAANGETQGNCGPARVVGRRIWHSVGAS